MLIAVDSKVLAEKLRFETAVGSDRAGHFPHYYGELSVEYANQVWTLERSAFALPEQLLHEIERIASVCPSNEFKRTFDFKLIGGECDGKLNLSDVARE